MNMKNTSVRL